jgi:hypothetical protein
MEKNERQMLVSCWRKKNTVHGWWKFTLVWSLWKEVLIFLKEIKNRKIILNRKSCFSNRHK